MRFDSPLTDFKTKGLPVSKDHPFLGGREASFECPSVAARAFISLYSRLRGRTDRVQFITGRRMIDTRLGCTIINSYFIFARI